VDGAVAAMGFLFFVAPIVQLAIISAIWAFEYEKSNSFFTISPTGIDRNAVSASPRNNSARDKLNGQRMHFVGGRAVPEHEQLLAAALERCQQPAGGHEQSAEYPVRPQDVMRLSHVAQ
jgi:hypothetical protein